MCGVQQPHLASDAGRDNRVGNGATNTDDAKALIIQLAFARHWLASEYSETAEKQCAIIARATF